MNKKLISIIGPMALITGAAVLIRNRQKKQQKREYYVRH